MRVSTGFGLIVFAVTIFIFATAACFAEEQCTESTDEQCAACTENSACTDCTCACIDGCLDEWWMIERYIGDEMVDQMGIQPKIGECMFFETGRDSATYSIQAYIVNYPLKENTMRLDLASSNSWYKGEIPNYGEIYVKQIDPNEHWIFRFGDREVISTNSFNPTKTHTYNVMKIHDGVETVWNETTISEGSFATLSFNNEPIIVLATTGSEGTRLPEDLADLEWLVFNCGEFGIVYVNARDDIDTIEVEIEGTRYSATK